MPPAAVDICASWIVQKNIHLKITRGRSTRFGDYLPLPGKRGHRITVNHDLNPYAFLVTFVHEVAHLHCHEKYKHRHDPHGKEWKHEYRKLLIDFIIRGIFPPELEKAIARSIRNPSASSCSDHHLLRVLKTYDTPKGEHVFHLEELPSQAVFKLNQSRQQLLFIKGEKMRTRYHCKEIHSGRIYFVSALAEVVLEQQASN